jgi:putative peptidoglycan lipid II flippase
MSIASPPTGSPPTGPQGQHQVMRAAGIVSLAFMASRLMGLIRDIAISYYFGASTAEVIAYTYASRIPEFIFNVTVGGALGSAFIPTFSAYFARDDEAGAWRLFSAVINLVLIATTALAGLAALLAPWIMASFISPVQSAEYPTLLPLATSMMRVMLLTPIIFGVSGVLMGALNARQHFLAPALAATMYNVGIIVGMVVLAPNVWGLAVGTVLGALGHLLVQIPSLRRERPRYQPIFLLKDDGVRQVLRLMGPRVLGLSFSYLNPIAIAFLTRPLTAASVVALERAFRITLMPYSIVGQALGVAAFPTLSTLAAQQDWPAMRRLIASALRAILFFGLPLAALLMVVRQPLVAILFERGEFTAEDTFLVSWGLLFYAIALIALAALEVVARAFYALQDTTTPVVAGIAQLPLMALFSALLAYVLFPRWGLLPLGGVALGYTLSNIVEVGALLWLLQRRLGGLDGHILWPAAQKLALAVVGMMAAMQATLWAMAETAVWWQLLLPSAVGAAVYLPLCWWLAIPETKQLLALLQKLTRGRI